MDRGLLGFEETNLRHALSYLTGVEQKRQDPLVVEKIKHAMRRSIRKVYAHLDEIEIPKGLRNVSTEIGEIDFMEIMPFIVQQSGIFKTLAIPNVAENKIGFLLGRNRRDFIRRLRDQYDIFTFAKNNAISVLRMKDEFYEQLSPFNWSRSIIVGIGATLITTGGILLPSSMGVSIILIVTGIMLTAYSGGS